MDIRWYFELLWGFCVQNALVLPFNLTVVLYLKTGSQMRDRPTDDCPSQRNAHEAYNTSSQRGTSTVPSQPLAQAWCAADGTAGETAAARNGSPTEIRAASR